MKTTNMNCVAWRCRSLLSFVILLLSSIALIPSASAGTLGTDVLAIFPNAVGEFAYLDLKDARQLKWFPALREQVVPEHFRQFERFLASAGMDINAQVDELAWGLIAQRPANRDGPGGAVRGGEQIVGLALGEFSPASIEAFFKRQKVLVATAGGLTLFAFGTGLGVNDLFFCFLDSHTAAFGHREALENLLEVRAGTAAGLLKNDRLFSLINETDGRGLFWAVLDERYAQQASRQLLPQALGFPQATQLFGKLHALAISIEADSTLDARLQAMCDSPEDANTFAALFQAAVMYRRYQEGPSNPDFAQILDEARTMPRGERLEIRFILTEDQMFSLIQRKTFTLRM